MGSGPLTACLVLGNLIKKFIVQQVVARVRWGHVIRLIDVVKNLMKYI